MTQPAIKVEGLSKEYIVGHAKEQHGTFYDLLANTLQAPFKRLRNLGGEAQETERFWALQDVSFEVQPGEVVGIIGRNGAGKSTLLKILSRITAPTNGRIEVRGRLASLLEVGTGFHPELSGRENIYLNGAILGMSQREVARKFDEIVSFAEIEKFIDTPVKRYSSGMYVRLAFSVAAHLDADVLLVDEVLAVGDSEFQRKCVGKIGDIRQDGRAIILVSHNMQLIKHLCPLGILLDGGRLSAIGNTEDLLVRYLTMSGGGSSTWTPNEDAGEPFQLQCVKVNAPAGLSPEAIPADKDFSIEFRYLVREEYLSGRIAFKIRNQFGISIFSSANTDASSSINKRWKRGRYRESCKITGGMLVPGNYHVTIAKPVVDGHAIFEDVCQFTVNPIGSLVPRDGRDGVVAPLLAWSAEEID